MGVSVSKMEKRFLYGTDVSPEECLTSGYPAVFLNKNGNKIAVFSFWDYDSEQFLFTWEWFNDEDQKSMLTDFLALDQVSFETYASYTGQTVNELKEDCKANSLSLLLAMRELGYTLIMESLESTSKAKEYRHVLEAVLYNKYR